MAIRGENLCKTNYTCWKCRKGVHTSRQSLHKALCEDGRNHYICSNCVENRTVEAQPKVVQQDPGIIPAMQCKCGNIAASRSMVDGLCIPCQKEKAKRENASPFSPDDVVKFSPLYAEEWTSKGRNYGIVNSCYNYGTQEDPNWAAEVQFLRERGERLVLSPTKVYMIASWQIEKVDRQWER